MRWLIAVVLALSSTARADPKLAAHIAPLFEQGRTWIYDTALTVWGETPERGHKPTKQTERETVTCKVAEVVARKGVLVSHITCDKDTNRKFRVAGFYAGSAAGLWQVGRDDAPSDDDLVDSLKEPPVIAAAPRAFRKVTKMGGPDPKHDDMINGIKTTAGGWCVYADSSEGDVDGGTQSRCFVAGVGLASGLDDVGGELDRFEYAVRKKR